VLRAETFAAEHLERNMAVLFFHFLGCYLQVGVVAAGGGGGGGGGSWCTERERLGGVGMWSGSEESATRKSLQP
jgi:hypothetical protein